MAGEAPAGRLELLAVAGLLLAHFLLALSGILVHTLTYDERTHLPAGMAAAATGEITLNRQHPPLVKLLAGLAANTAHPRLPLEGEAYREGREWEFGHEVLFAAGNDPAVLLHRGRLPTLLISLLGGFFVYLMSRRLFGARAGVFSLALWAFSPSVLGHDGWVTMDAAVAALSTGALYFAFRLGAALAAGQTGRAPALAAGVFLGLALAAKFSGLVFAAALAPLAAFFAWRHGRSGPGTPRDLLTAAGVAVAAAAAVLWAIYLFPRDPLFYLHDVSRLYQDLKPDYLFYLHGEFARRFPHYFLATFALKSTPVELLLLPLAACAAWASPRRREILAFVVWPGLFFFGVTSAFATNQGHRYILPCYPLLFVAAGGILPWLAPRLSRAGLLLGLLGFAQASEAVWHQPDHLAYFNAFAGGPRRGPYWLDDSNVDWDQEMGRLPGWLAARGIHHVRGAFMGRVDPSFYGLDWQPISLEELRDGPRPGAYVMSAHVLARLLKKVGEEGWKSDWLYRYQPTDVLGGSLFLYVFPEPQPGREAEEDSTLAGVR